MHLTLASRHSAICGLGGRGKVSRCKTTAEELCGHVWPTTALVVYQLNVSVIYQQRIADMAYQLHIRLYQVAYQVDISSRAYQAVSGAYQLDMHLIRSGGQQ